MKGSKMKKMKKRILAALLCTTMMLNTGVSAMADGGTAVSSESAHVHTEECYEKSKTDNLICTKAETAEGHVHGDECYEVTSTPELICTQAETAGHTHGDSCMETTKNLTCGAEEHTHGGDCYETETKDVCSDELEEHTCGDGCVETEEVLKCKKSEHTHDDGCYESETKMVCGQDEVEAHTHGEGCYTTAENKTLKCTLEEVEAHTHNDECYAWEEKLVCTLAETAPAAEQPEKEEKASEKPEAEKITLTEEVGENMTVEAAADFPEGTKLSAAELTEEDEIYEAVVTELNEWAAAQEKEVLGFVGYDISMKDAEEEAVVLEDAAELEISYEEAVLPADVDGAKVTDVQFVHITENEEGELTAEEVGTVELDEEKAATAISFETASFSPFAALWMGDAEKAVEEAVEDATVKEPTYITLEKEVDGVKVTLTAEEGVVPEGAELSVTPITADNAETKEQYEEVEQQLADKIAEENEANEETKEIAGFLAYDIKLVVTDAEGNVTETEPDGEVKVSMEYKEAMIPEAVELAEDLAVTVHHFEEDENGEVKEIVDMIAEEAIEAAVTLTENIEIEKAEFVTNSFSIFTITWNGNYWSNGSITANCVDTSGKTINGNSNNGEFKITQATSISQLINKNIAGYEFVRAYLANKSTSADKTVVTALRYNTYSGYQYRWEYQSNSSSWASVFGNLYFEYKPVVILEEIPTITVEADNIVTITVKHYLGSQQLYQTKVHTLTPGRWVLEDITVTGNYDVISIVDVTDDPANPVNVTGDITVSTDKEYAVYYSPQTGTIESDVQMFDYQVNSGTQSGVSGTVSINHPSNYPVGSGDDQRMSSGKVDQSGQPYKYNTNIAKGNINAFTGGSNPREGIITGVNYLTGELTLSSNTSGEPIFEPGFFVNNPSIMGHDILGGYTLKFNQVGDTYTLDSVWKGDVKQDDAGPDFYPLDSRKTEYTEKSDNDHNHFFGMRYDIEFTIGEYVGDLNYTFTGDDDLWVVLDAAKGGGRVVIDIGGIHRSAKKSVDLWGELFGDRDRASLTEEEKSETHTLTILYMERGAGESNCNMSFTLPNTQIINPVKNTVLTVEKTVSGNMADVNKEFTFYVKVGEGATQEVQLKNGESSRIYVEKNSHVEVWEDAEDYTHSVITAPDEYQTLSGKSGISFVMPADDTEVTFNNDKTAYVKIVKTWEGPENNVPGQLEVKLMNGESQTVATATMVESADGKWEVVLPITEAWSSEWYVDEVVSEEFLDLWQLNSSGWKQETTDGNTTYVTESGTYGEETVECYVYNLVNRLNTKSAAVQKVWDDYNNVELRPEDLDITLTYEREVRGNKISGDVVTDSNGTKFTITIDADGNSEDSLYTVFINGVSYDVTVSYSSWGASIAGLPNGYTYDFVEESIDGYKQTSKTISGDTVTLTNSIDLRIIKKSIGDDEKVLSGAIFKLEATGTAGTTYYGKSGNDGLVEWYMNQDVQDSSKINDEKLIQNGSYTLREIQAPAGYAVSTETWNVEVLNGVLRIQVGGEDLPGKPIYGEDGMLLYCAVYFDNIMLYELPSTGGHGIYSITLSGLTLMLGAAYVWFANRRKEMFH